MSKVIKDDGLCYLILICITFMASMAQAAIAFALALLTFIYLLIVKKITPNSSALIKKIFIVGAICQLIGVHGYVNNDIYYSLKDSWYFINVVLYVLLGVISYGVITLRCKFIWALFLSGAMSSIVLLSSIIKNPVILGGSAIDIRSAVGFGYFDSAMSLVLGAYLYGEKKNYRKRKIIVLLMMCCLLAIIFSFSRGIALTSVIGLLAFYGFFRVRPVFKMIVAGLLFVCFVIIVRGFTDLDDPSSYTTFLGKIAHIFEEGNMSANMSFEEINSRWRGYETAVAFEQYVSGDIFKLLFGQGFGSLVDIGIYIVLGSDKDNLVRYIEILHNGYMYVLFKTGFIGLCLVIFSFAYMFRCGAGSALFQDKRLLMNSDLLKFSIISLALSTWSTSGIFNKDGTVGLIMLMGYCFSKANSYKHGGFIRD